MFKLVFSLLPHLLFAFGCMKWFEGDYQVFILALLIVCSYKIYIWIFNSIAFWVGYFLKTGAELESYYLEFFKSNNFPKIMEGSFGFTDPVKYLDVVCRTEEFDCEIRLKAANLIAVFNWMTTINEVQAKKRLSLAFESAIRKYYQQCCDNDYYKMSEFGYDEIFSFGKVSLRKISKDEKIPAL